MFFFLIGTVFVGIILGLRFNVFVLVPAILLAIALITLSGMSRTHQSAGAILFVTFAAVVLLQWVFRRPRSQSGNSSALANLDADGSSTPVGIAKIEMIEQQLGLGTCSGQARTCCSPAAVRSGSGVPDRNFCTDPLTLHSSV